MWGIARVGVGGARRKENYDKQANRKEKREWEGFDKNEKKRKPSRTRGIRKERGRRRRTKRGKLNYVH